MFDLAVEKAKSEILFLRFGKVPGENSQLAGKTTLYQVKTNKKLS